MTTDGVLAFGIYFTGFRDVYSTVGDMVTGEVVLKLEKYTEIKDIDLCISGACDVHLHSKCPVKDRSPDVKCPMHARKDYFKIRHQLFPPKSVKQGGETALPAGRHAFSFEVGIPAISLPHSFEGDLGYVRYTAHSTLRTARRKHDTRRAFSMLCDNMDSFNSGTLEPFTVSRVYTPTLGLLCYGQESALKIVISLPRVSYFAGDNIPISVKITNKSGHKVDGITADFMQGMFCRIGRNTKSSLVKMASMEIKETKIESNVMQTIQTIRIPPVAPSNLINCELIELEYELRITVIISKRLRTKKLVFRIPIEIGNVPLQDETDVNGNVSCTEVTKYEMEFVECPNGPRCIREPGDCDDGGFLDYTPVYRVYKLGFPKS